MLLNELKALVLQIRRRPIVSCDTTSEADEMTNMQIKFLITSLEEANVVIYEENWAQWEEEGGTNPITWLDAALNEKEWDYSYEEMPF